MPILPKIRIIDRYIFKELIPTFFLGLFVFTFVMLTNIIIQLLDLVITRGVGLVTTAKLLGLSVPFLLVMTIPMSVLLAVLVTFSRFSSDSEITVMKASGMCIHRMMPPVMLFAFLTYALTSFIYISFLPRTNLMLKQLKFDIIRTKANIGIKPHVFNTDFIHLVIYANEVHLDQGQLEGIFISDNRNLDKPIVIVATRGYELFDPIENAAKLRLEDGCTHELYRGHLQRYSLTPFTTMDLNLDMSILRQETVAKSDREMTVNELLQKARANELAGKNQSRQWVEIWKKTALPFACIVFAFLAVPLGISTKRGGKSSSFAISIGLILVYYILLTGATGLAEDGYMSPFIATWLPNTLLAALAIYLYGKLVTENPIFWVSWIQSRFEGFLSLIINKYHHFSHKYSKSKQEIKRVYRVGRILDRYFVKQFLRFFIYIESALISISLIVHAFERIDNLVENHASFWNSFVAIAFKLPYFGYLAMPFAILVASILTIGMFTRTSELIAIKASGISYLRSTVPLLITSIVLSVIVFFCNESVIPLFNRRVEIAWDKIKNRERTRFVRYHRWYRSKSGDIYYFQHFDPQKRTISGFSKFRIDEKMHILSRSECDEMFWDLDNWVSPITRQIHMTPDCRVETDVAYEDTPVEIPETPDDFAKEHKESEEMNVRELSEYINLLRQVGFDTVEYEVDWHAKFSIPFLCIIMSLIGIASSSQKPRAGSGLMGVGVSIFIGSAYFLVFRVGLELGQASKLTPFMAAWFFNIMSFILGFWMLLRTNRT